MKILNIERFKDLATLTKTFDKLGVAYELTREEGWGLPEYRDSDMDYPPMVYVVRMGQNTMYFDETTGAYRGWYNHEYSHWKERREQDAQD